MRKDSTPNCGSQGKIEIAQFFMSLARRLAGRAVRPQGAKAQAVLALKQAKAKIGEGAG
jgi:hypothetical protein